ncbi:MAG: AAA family ATPase, partial [Leptolyngbyaceae cyanobacterium]
MDNAEILLPYCRLTDKLHEGTRTLVYRGKWIGPSAADSAQERSVIVKFLKSDYPSFVELVQFRNQYAIAQQLDIPGVVKPLALEPYQNSYALVMEDGGYVSLKQWLESKTDAGGERPESGQLLPLSVDEVLSIAIQIAEILHHLHCRQVIHKDIKPANILIHPEKRTVQLADFSISTLLSKEQQSVQNPNILEGTLAYIAPEQTGRMNRGIDYRADFYALGVTLYELLTGQLPFNASDPMEVVHCHIAQPPPPMASIVLTNQGKSDRPPISSIPIPLILEQLVLKLMAKNAEDRYQSGFGLKHDLETCLAQWQEAGTITPFRLGQRDQGDRFLIPEKLYGRESEVNALLDAFERVAQPPLIDPSQPNRSRQSELVLVAGYSGVGKTAVIHEVHKPIARQRGYFIKGKFDQFQRDIPFSAFVQAFRDLMGQLLAESDAQLARWQTQILAALGENGQVMIDVIPELEAIIGLQAAVPELSDNASRNRFNRLFRQFIQVFAQPEHPLVLFLDDLQWADAASLQLLSLMVGGGDTGHLLILGAYRDNEVSAAHPLMLTLDEIRAAEGMVQTVTLAPLRVIDLRQLVADTLHCRQNRAATLTELVYRKTQGNPFFATQFLKGLYAEGLIFYDVEPSAGAVSDPPVQGGWQCDMAKVRELALTDDVVEFMGRQLQLLPTNTQYVLTMAACIGNQFDLATLAMVCDRPPATVAQALWPALHKEAIVPINETYKFYPTPAGKNEAKAEGRRQKAEGKAEGRRQKDESLPSPYGQSPRACPPEIPRACPPEIPRACPPEIPRA